MLAPMAESVDDLQPWPRAGETWAPVLPWPRAECPAGFYAWGVSGDPDFRMGILRPVSRERAIAEAWEYRYGTATGLHPHYSPGAETSAHGKGRFGPEPVTIEQVGGALVYARRYDGARITLSARDLRRAFARVNDPPPGYTVLDELESDEPLYTWRHDGEVMGRESTRSAALAAAWAHHHAAVAQAQKVIDSAATAAGAVNWPPGYSGQVIGTAGSDGVKFAFSVNDDLNPFTHPEQIGRMPPDDRLRDTPEACVAAAWAHYRANGGPT